MIMDNGNGASNSSKSSNVPSALDTTMVRLPVPYTAPPPAPMPPVAPQAAQASSGPPGLAAAPTMGALMHALRRRWLSAATLGVLGAALTAAAVFFVMPPKYLAEARLIVDSGRQPNIGIDRGADTEFVIFKANLPALIKAPL